MSTLKLDFTPISTLCASDPNRLPITTSSVTKYCVLVKTWRVSVTLWAKLTHGVKCRMKVSTISLRKTWCSHLQESPGLLTNSSILFWLVAPTADAPTKLSSRPPTICLSPLEFGSLSKPSKALRPRIGTKSKCA
jgi:hypothetical protein